MTSPDIDLVYGHHAHVVQPLQQINGKWVIYGLGNAIAAHATPVDATREGLLVRVTFSQDSGVAGRPVTSLGFRRCRALGPPHRWCPLTAGNSCADPALDAAVLTRTTEIVNRYGAAAAGAHPLDQP